MSLLQLVGPDYRNTKIGGGNIGQMILMSLLTEESSFKYTRREVEVWTPAGADHYLVRCHVLWKAYSLVYIILELECM